MINLIILVQRINNERNAYQTKQEHLPLYPGIDVFFFGISHIHDFETLVHKKPGDFFSGDLTFTVSLLMD